jgi:purine-cytosine permease-like protein
MECMHLLVRSGSPNLAMALQSTLTWKRMSANMAVATLSTGMDGGSMGLAFWDCFAIIIVVNLLSCLLPAWTASFGLTGLRMTTFSSVFLLLYVYRSTDDG